MRGNKKQLYTFSHRSRCNLLQQIAKIDYEYMGQGLHVVLTYPGEWETNPEIWKRHLHNFRRSMDRRYDGWCALWRIEPQRRGAPHYHMIVWGIPDLETQTESRWMKDTWWRIVGSGDENHRNMGVKVIHVEGNQEEYVKTRYLAFYGSKDNKNGKSEIFEYPIGRYWGFHHRHILRLHDKDEYLLDQQQFTVSRRIIRKFYDSQARRFARKTGKKPKKGPKYQRPGIWVLLKQETILKFTQWIIESKNEGGCRYVLSRK